MATLKMGALPGMNAWQAIVAHCAKLTEEALQEADDEGWPD